MLIAIAAATLAISIWDSAIELDKNPTVSSAQLKELEAKLDEENERLDREIYSLLKEHKRLCQYGKKSIQ